MALGSSFFSSLVLQSKNQMGIISFPVNLEVSLQQYMLPRESNPQFRIFNSQDTKTSLYQKHISLDKSSSVAHGKKLGWGDD